jgi:hypothetical protein
VPKECNLKYLIKKKDLPFKSVHQIWCTPLYGPVQRVPAARAPAGILASLL